MFQAAGRRLNSPIGAFGARRHRRKILGMFKRLPARAGVLARAERAPRTDGDPAERAVGRPIPGSAEPVGAARTEEQGGVSKQEGGERPEGRLRPRQQQQRQQQRQCSQGALTIQRHHCLRRRHRRRRHRHLLLHHTLTAAALPTTAVAAPRNLWHGQPRPEGRAAIGRADDGDVCGQDSAVRRARRRRR